MNVSCSSSSACRYLTCLVGVGRAAAATGRREAGGGQSLAVRAGRSRRRNLSGFFYVLLARLARNAVAADDRAGGDLRLAPVVLPLSVAAIIGGELVGSLVRGFGRLRRRADRLPHAEARPGTVAEIRRPAPKQT